MVTVSIVLCCSLGVTELRQMVADHLVSNKDHYIDFIVAPNTTCNADTARSREEDAHIASIQHPATRTQLQFDNYVHGVRNNAWGESVALCDVFNITINLLRVRIDRPGGQPIENTLNLTPSNSARTQEIDIALVMQFHSVALDKVEPSVPNLPVVQISQPQNCSSSDSKSDLMTDEEVAEGDAHTVTIIGGPSPTMLYEENPVAVVNIAPCEGEKPIAILSDKKVEEMANPTKFPYGKGGFNIPHPKKLTPRKYFNQRLLGKDGRFACDLDYTFTAQYTIESKQIFDDANNYIWRQKPSRTFTAAQARNLESLYAKMKHISF